MHRVVFFIFIVCVAGLSGLSPVARAELPVPGVDWKRPWIAPGQTQITPTNLGDLLAIAKEDPEVVALLKKFWDRTGIRADNAKALFEIFDFCVSGNAGNAQQEIRTQIVPRKPERPVHPGVQALIKPGAVLVEDRPFYQLWTRTDCNSCIAPGLTLRGAYNTFVHEITHLTETIAVENAEEFLERFPNEEAYFEVQFTRPGGEFDAVKRGVRAAIRASRAKVLTAGDPESTFNDAGDLISPRHLRRAILEDGVLQAGSRKEYIYRLNVYLLDNILIREELIAGQAAPDSGIDPYAELRSQELRRLDGIDARLRAAIAAVD